MESSRGGFVKVTHREGHCCSGSWACSPKSEHLFSTDLYQQVSGPLKERGEKNDWMIDDWMVHFIPKIWCMCNTTERQLILVRMHNHCNFYLQLLITFMVILANANDNDHYFSFYSDSTT